MLEDVELLVEAGDEFSEEKIARGDQTPVFFGSALTNFGVQTFLETFLQFAPAPHAHKTEEGGEVSPYEKNFQALSLKFKRIWTPPIVIELLLFEFVQVFLKEAWTWP